LNTAHARLEAKVLTAILLRNPLLSSEEGSEYRPCEGASEGHGSAALRLLAKDIWVTWEIDLSTSLQRGGNGCCW
jgi:hypothetical protein